MKSSINRLLSLGITILAATTLAARGGGSSGETTNSGNRTGTVSLVLTDAPADPDQFVQVNASIESVELLGGEDGPISLYAGPTLGFDLLELKNEAIPFTFQDNIPTGSYCKIRLTLSDLELVETDATPEDLSDNPTHHPKLPGNGKLDLVARDCFEVTAGGTVTLQLDIDAGKSIHIVGNGKGYAFRPVVFVDVIQGGFVPKLIRVSGVIDTIDELENEILSCNVTTSSHNASRGCVRIDLGDDSAFFDNQQYSGAPRPLDELLTADRVGAELTVVGWPDMHIEPYIAEKIPPGHLPPQGECKLWDVTQPPGHQPAPISCDEVPDALPDNTIVVTYQGQDDSKRPWLAIDALAIELGDFQKVAGEVCVDADSSGFQMALAATASIILDSDLQVAFQSGDPGVNGTRIVSRDGELLAFDDVDVPLPLQVDGILDLTGIDPLLHAALVIVDTESSPNAEQVNGTILSLDSTSLVLDPDAEEACGAATNALEVDFAVDMDISTLDLSGPIPSVIPSGTLATDQLVAMSGECTATG